MVLSSASDVAGEMLGRARVYYGGSSVGAQVDIGVFSTGDVWAQNHACRRYQVAVRCTEG